MGRLARWEPWMAAGLLLVQVAADAAWILQDRLPPFSDSPGHLVLAFRWWRFFTGGGAWMPDPFPPLTYAVTACGFSLAGVGVIQAALSLQPFSLLFSLSLRSLGLRLGGAPGGLACLLAAGGVSWAQLYRREYFLDFPTAALVALAAAALVASRGFRRPGPTVLLGLALGLGMLTKWTVPFFLALPVALAALPSLVAGWRSLVALLAGLGALAWTGWALHQVMFHSNLAPGAIALFPANLLAFLAWLWIVTALVALALRRPPRATVPAAGVEEAGVPVGPAGTRGGGEWIPGAGLTLALCLGALTCLPWYVGVLSKMADKIRFEAAIPVVFETSLLYNLSCLGRAFWLAPLLLLGGLVLALRDRETRWSACILAAGLAGGICLIARLAPPDPRYLVPAWVFLVPLAFGPWGRLKQAPWAVLLVGAIAWIPGNLGWLLSPEAPPGNQVRVILGTQAQELRQMLSSSYPTILWVGRPPARIPCSLKETLDFLVSRGATKVAVRSSFKALVNVDNLRQEAVYRELEIQFSPAPWPEADAQVAAASMGRPLVEPGPGWVARARFQGGPPDRETRWVVYLREGDAGSGEEGPGIPEDRGPSPGPAGKSGAPPGPAGGGSGAHPGPP